MSLIKMIALTILLSSTTQAYDVKLNATATSDYIWRGLTQKNSRAAIQGGIELLPTESISIAT